MDVVGTVKSSDDGLKQIETIASTWDDAVTHEDTYVTSIIEGLLLASSQPLTLKVLGELLEDMPKDRIQHCINELMRKYDEERAHGITIQKVAGGYCFRTKPQISPWVKRLLPDKMIKLSRPALVTLSIVAYKQPITRAEIEQVRSCDSSGVLKQLIKRELVKIIGKKDVPGKPALFGTTRNFLEYLGVNSLKDLPSLREFHEQD